MLLRRRRVDALDAVERLVGMQAQVPRDPYVALWSRLDRFRPERLAEPLAERRAVRMTLLRGTLHLVTADDALALRPLLQPVVERTLYGSSPLRTVAGSVDVDELLAMFEDLFAEGPRTRAQLVAAIAERWPERDASSLGYAMYPAPDGPGHARVASGVVPAPRPSPPSSDGSDARSGAPPNRTR